MSWHSRLDLMGNARASQAARGSWLVFTALAVSMSIASIPRYVDILRSPCDGTQCFGAQLTTEAAQAWAATGENLLLYAVLRLLVSLTIDALLMITAAFLIWRRVHNRAAVLAAFVGTALATSTLSQALAHTDPRFVPAAHLLLFMQMAGIVPLFCLFPDGHFQPPGIRWVALGYVVASLIYLSPRHRAWSAPGTTGYLLSLGLKVIAVVVVVTSLGYRFRRAATSVQQEQLWWVLASIGLATPVMLLDAPFPLLSAGVWGSGMEMLLISMFLAVGSITCMLVALVNFEPLDADMFVNRALVYGALTVCVIGGYGLIVGFLSTAFRSDNVLFSLVATGLIAVLFQVVRDRVQRAVNRLMYGDRDDPYAVITDLGERLQAALAPGAVLPTIVEAVAEALKVPYVAVVAPNRLTGTNEVVAAIGEPGADIVRFPLVYQGETVAALLVRPRSGEASLSNTDRRLLTDLAKQAGPVVHGVRLMTELQQITTELQRARETLVLTREEDRRRMRRDLHDELAPGLAGLSLTAGTIRSVARSDPAAVEELATALQTALRRAVGDIRRLVYDLRPPALDDLGLVAAIRERAAQFSTPAGAPVQVTVDLVGTLPPLPAALEVAAYRIVQEALMNVVRHAHATTCRIQIGLGHGRAATRCLELVIVDDGVGVDDNRRAGIGLRSMRERAEEVGGLCEVGAGAGGGTRVFVQLPIAMEEGHEQPAHSAR
jgi:signal transduction histidine kinase